MIEKITIMKTHDGDVFDALGRPYKNGDVVPHTTFVRRLIREGALKKMVIKKKEK